MSQIETDLLSLLIQKIPDPIKHEIGFLEFTKQQTKEIINSRVYEYFLNQDYHPDIANVFLTALLNLIHRHNATDISFDDFTCVSEESTAKGNRIDLLIRDDKSKTAIIIENKIYHYLNNDLNDYWDHIKFDNANKRGVLLTLYKLKIPYTDNMRFVNITHKEWINEIKRIGLPSNIDIKKYVYLNDFFTTMEQLTNNTSLNDQAEFYFKHTEQIIKAQLTYKEAISFVSSQLNMLGDHLNCEVIGKDCWRNFRNENNSQKVFYTIVYDDLIKSDRKRIKIIIELGEKGLFQLDKITIDPDLKEIIKDLVPGNAGDGRTWKHYLTKTYDVNQENIRNLSEFLNEKINDDFKGAMEKITQIIS